MAKAKRTRAEKLTGVTVRSYQVGFGDCFLLTFHYSSPGGKAADKHVLMDCGSTGKPAKAPSLKEVADAIAVDCGGKLTAVVATHRHADHINGFATSSNRKDGSGDVIRKLKPDLVIQPWTEDPKTAANAVAPARAARNSKTALTSALYVSGLEGMHDVADAVRSEVQRIGRHLSASMREQLSFLGEENLKNLSAVKNLMAMGKAGKAEYLCYGQKTSLEKLLPGVKVRVLGPPTVKQYPDVAKQRSKDASEFWQIMGVSTGRLGSLSLNPFPGAPAYKHGRIPPASRWLIGRIRAVHGAQRLGLVRALDDAMNNTSLILLFEAGGKRFLFPGDAQIENWNYALKDSDEADENCELLKNTDFYKVGHHGSRNATPKTLWELFSKRNANSKSNRLETAVSTMLGKHGSSNAHTEVPRKSLVQALKVESNYHSTQTIPKKDQSYVIQFQFGKRAAPKKKRPKRK